MNIKEKLLASGIHFTASLLVFSFFTFILFTRWYPTPYFTASGGWQGLKLVVLVDLILGPLLTFIVFSKLKSRREIVLDLSVIIAIQLSALIWGGLTVYQERPLAAVFWDDRFYTVPAKALAQHYRNSEPYQDLLAESGIPLLFAKKPQNMLEHEVMMQLIQQKDIPPHHQMERYEPFKPRFSEIKFLSMDMHEFINSNSTMKRELASVLESNGSKIDDNVYLQLESKYQNIVFIFDQSGNHLGFIKAPYKKNE